ncbi:MAG: hypothetical protein V3U73_05195, partial [bacterium]
MSIPLFGSNETGHEPERQPSSKSQYITPKSADIGIRRTVQRRDKGVEMKYKRMEITHPILPESRRSLFAS